MSIKIPYVRKKIPSTLLTLSAVALMLSSPMLFFNVLQPVQAQTTMTFKTAEPASGTSKLTGEQLTLTFDAQGTTSSSDSQSAKITNGTFQMTNSSDGSIVYSSNIPSGNFTDGTSGGSLTMGGQYRNEEGVGFSISTSCSTSNGNAITVRIDVLPSGSGEFDFTGPVECTPSQGGGDTTTESMTAGRSQDRDGDGIPDSSDRCTHNSNPRCFKEDTGATTQ